MHRQAPSTAASQVSKQSSTRQLKLGRRCLLAVCNEAKVVARIVCKFPSTLVLPLLLLGILLGLEIPGIHYFRHQMIHSRKLKSEVLSESVAASLQLQLQVALKPMDGMDNLIHAEPYWPRLSKLAIGFGNSAIKVDAQNMTQSILLALMPNAWVSLLFPPPPVPLDPKTNMDALADHNRARNLKTIEDGTMHHYPFTGIDSFSILRPIYIDGAAPNETFGYPRPPTNCTVCYDPVKKRRFWGFLNAIIPRSVVVEPRRNELDQLHELSRYALYAPLDKDFATLDIGVNVSTPKTKLVEVNGTWTMQLDATDPPPSFSQSIRTMVKITNDYGWWLLVETRYGDIDKFTNALYAALIIGTCILAGMFFAALLSRRKHQLLLECLVPDNVIKQAKTQAGYLSNNKPIVTEGSTADLMLKIAADVASGRLPSLREALTLRTAVLQRWNLYAPINLGNQLRQGHLDADVSAALMQQLLGRNSPNNNRNALEVPLKPHHEDEDDGWGFFESFSNLQAALVALLPSTIPSLSRVSTAVDDEAQSDQVSIVVDQVLLDSAERILGLANSCWQFDVFELADATNGYPLSTLGFFIMHQQGMISKFKLDSGKLARFLRNIEDGYRRTNPFHNSTHAAACLQTMHLILTQGGLVSGGYADDLTMLAAYLAAIIIDFDHCGLTNDFLINTEDDLACQYNDRSPLENHHVAAAWFLLKQQNMNFLRPNLSKEQVAHLRKIVVDMVLATDLKQHFSIVNMFATTANNMTSGAKLQRSRLDSKSMDAGERVTMLQLALKCSDLGHTTATLQTHKRWMSCQEEELFKQGDMESALSLPVSPLFDRKKPGISKSQAGFFNVVVVPMYTAFCTAFPNARPLLDGAKANFEYWKAVQPWQPFDAEVLASQL